MTIETMAEVESELVESEQVERDRVAIAAAVAAVIGRPVRIERIEAHVEGRADRWVREGRRAVQSRQMSAPLAREWPR